MKSYKIGRIHKTQKVFRIPRLSFDTHWHLIGGTGKGKTTAIHTIFHNLLLDVTHSPCVFVIDRMGNLSSDILRWVTSEFCTDDIRQRVVYIEPSREDVILGFNPLLYETEGHAYYKVSRASEIILRGWTSQDLAIMPRLARWLHNSFYACALLGLTIADAVHLLHPGSQYHRHILAALPPQLKYEWSELIDSRAAEVGRILESTRNRLKPFFDSPQLRCMFGATTNRLDVRRFMREGKVVILNLAENNRLPPQVCDAIGGLVINEVLTTARSLPPVERSPTYLFLDEFQRFVGPDLESAIPEVRQLGIKLIMSNQSFCQLERGDVDLTSMIFQAQSRMIFGVQGEDADLLATELASLQFDPRRIKEELYTRRQRVAGHRTAELSSWSQADSDARNWNRQFGQSWSKRESVTKGPLPWVRSEGSDRGTSDNRGEGGSSSTSRTSGSHETLVPVHEDFEELASRTYVAFDEDLHVWARDIRQLPTGSAFVRLVDQPELNRVDILRDAPGHLAWDITTLAQEMPEVLEAVEQFKQENFQSEFFVSPAVIEAETQKRLERVVSGRITIVDSPQRKLDLIPATEIRPAHEDQTNSADSNEVFG